MVVDLRKQKESIKGIQGEIRASHNQRALRPFLLRRNPAKIVIAR